MNIILSTLLYVVLLITQHYRCLKLIDIQQNPEYNSATEEIDYRSSEMYETYLPTKEKRITDEDRRKYWLINEKPEHKIYVKANPFDEDKDSNFKSKISMLIEQTMHDTEKKIQNVVDLRDEHREQPPYRAGFVLSLLRKSRNVLNELFNVAIKHRKEWKALEQLKIFELMMHTNVDTNNLVKQLDDIHQGHLNASKAENVQPAQPW